MASPGSSSEDKTSQPTEKDKLDKYRNEPFPSLFKRDPQLKKNPELNKTPGPDAGQDGTVQGGPRKGAHGPSKRRKPSRITTDSSLVLEDINEKDENLGALDQKANDEPNTK